MQTLSLEDEFKLFDGVPYDINFSQDYSAAFWGEIVLSDAHPAQIICAILSPPEVPALPTSTEHNNSGLDWRAIDKEMRKEAKWKKHHKNVKKKDAIKNFEKMMKKWGL